MPSLKEMQPWPNTLPLRRWQLDASRGFITSDKRDFLVVATPGAGKTVFALRCAHAAMMEGTVQRVVIVVPTEHLKEQWRKAAIGILRLQKEWGNGQGFAADYDGVVVTYQQVAQSPEFHRMFCSVPTFCIIDEIHHAGEAKSWGSGLQRAYENCVRRLLLSGTPFRTDNNPIPFVTYEGSKCVADYTFGYGQALRESVCRPVLFPMLEARAEWISKNGVVSATFADDLCDRESSERLRTALAPECESLRSMLNEADQQLTEIRAGEHRDAGGLVIAMDKRHAAAIAGLLGGDVVTVGYEDPDASDKIKAFTQGSSRWIVAVRLISEGVDIPRLRVAVYATNVQTELFFRQAVGRLVRVLPNLEEQSAYFFIPKDPALVAFAQRIREERNHELREEIEAQRREMESRGDQERKPSLFAPISGVATPDGVIFDQDEFPQWEIERARELASRRGVRIPSAQLASLLRDFSTGNTALAAPVQPAVSACRDKETEMTSLEERKKNIRAKINRMGAQYAKATGLDYQDVFIKLARIQGVLQSEATFQQLEERYRILADWLEKGQ